MTRMTRPDCAVIYVQFNKYTHAHTHREVFVTSIIDLPLGGSPWEDQCEWHIMTRMTGPDCAVMCNLINTHTHKHISGGSP